MTLRERMLGVYRGVVPDAGVVGIYSRYLPRGDIERGVRNANLGVIDYAPLTSQVGPPWHLLPGYLGEVRGAETRVRYLWDSGRLVESRECDTPRGSVFARVEKSLGAGSEHIRSYYVKGMDDYAAMAYIVENAVVRDNEALYSGLAGGLGGDGVVLGRLDRSPYQKLLLEWCGAERFFMDLADEPETLEALMESMERRWFEQLDVALKSAAPVLWVPDNVTVDMVPPHYFRKYHLPLYHKAVALAHAAGKLVAAHFDGKARPLVGMIREIGFDVIESVSDPMIGGDMDYQTWLKELPGTVILPNFPANLSHAPDEAVLGHIRSLREAARGRPFMLQISEDLPDGAWKRVVPLVCRGME